MRVTIMVEIHIQTCTIFTFLLKIETLQITNALAISEYPAWNFLSL